MVQQGTFPSEVSCYGALVKRECKLIENYRSQCIQCYMQAWTILSSFGQDLHYGKADIGSLGGQEM